MGISSCSGMEYKIENIRFKISLKKITKIKLEGEKTNCWAVKNSRCWSDSCQSEPPEDKRKKTAHFIRPRYWSRPRHVLKILFLKFILNFSPLFTTVHLKSSDSYFRVFSLSSINFLMKITEEKLRVTKIQILFVFWNSEFFFILS